MKKNLKDESEINRKQSRAQQNSMRESGSALPVINEEGEFEEPVGGEVFQEPEPVCRKTSGWKKFTNALFPWKKWKERAQELSEQLKSSEARAQKLSGKLESAMADIRALSGQIEGWKDKERFLFEELEAWNARAKYLSGQLEAAESNARALREDLDTSKANQVDLKKRLEEKDSFVAQIRREISEEREKNEQSLDRIDELQKENEHIRKWITAKTMLEENDPRAKSLLKEIENFRYAAEAVSGIAVICETIEQYGTYDLLKLRVDQIVQIINVYREKTGK